MQSNGNVSKIPGRLHAMSEFHRGEFKKIQSYQSFGFPRDSHLPQADFPNVIAQKALTSP